MYEYVIFLFLLIQFWWRTLCLNAFTYNRGLLLSFELLVYLASLIPEFQFSMFKRPIKNFVEPCLYSSVFSFNKYYQIIIISLVRLRSFFSLDDEKVNWKGKAIGGLKGCLFLNRVIKKTSSIHNSDWYHRYSDSLVVGNTSDGVFFSLWLHLSLEGDKCKRKCSRSDIESADSEAARREYWAAPLPVSTATLCDELCIQSRTRSRNTVCWPHIKVFRACNTSWNEEN